MIRVLSLVCSRHTHTFAICIHGQNFEEKVKLMKYNEIYAPSFELRILDYFVRYLHSKGIVTLQNRRLQYNFRSVKAIDRDATSEFVLARNVRGTDVQVKRQYSDVTTLEREEIIEDGADRN